MAIDINVNISGSYKFEIDFSDITLPYDIATTIPEGSEIYYMSANMDGLVAVGATEINIGIETQQEDFAIITDFTDGIRAFYSTSETTGAVNRNLVVKAIGGTFSAGTMIIKFKTA